MSGLLVYHNSSCSKSRGAIEILRERGIDFEVVEYLQTGLERAQLEEMLDKLPNAPGELVRRDKNFKELGLTDDDCATREAIVTLLVREPKLLQRPVAIAGDRAVIARPSERVLELVDG